jgi:hypothetical protein
MVAGWPSPCPPNSVNCVIEGVDTIGDPCPADGEGLCYELVNDSPAQIDCEPANTVNCVIDGVDTIGDPCPADGEG